MQPAGSMLDKIVSSYHAVYGGHMDEDVSLGKCRKAMSYIEKVDKEIGPDMHQGMFSYSIFRPYISIVVGSVSELRYLLASK